MTETNKIIEKVCQTCKSDDLVINARVFWDSYSHMYIIDEIYHEETYCSECQELCAMVETIEVENQDCD